MMNNGEEPQIITDEFFMRELVESLAQLASTAENQILWLDRIRVPVDELALSFDDMRVVAHLKAETGLISLIALESIKTLDSFLGSFSGEKNSKLWTYEALSEASQWATVRVMASKCLDELKSG